MSPIDAEETSKHLNLLSDFLLYLFTILFAVYMQIQAYVCIHAYVYK